MPQAGDAAEPAAAGCASPRLCPAVQGWEGTQRARLCSCPARGAQAAAGGAPGSFHPALLWQTATGCPGCPGTMGRKALIPAAMDTLLLQGGADGRNWGLGYLLLSFVNRCWLLVVGTAVTALEGLFVLFAFDIQPRECPLAWEREELSQAHPLGARGCCPAVLALYITHCGLSPACWVGLLLVFQRK